MSVTGAMMSLLGGAAAWLGLAVGLLSFGLYAAFQIACGSYFRYQNLRTRYNASWALVTGASTGASSCAYQRTCAVGCMRADDDLPHA